MTFDATAPQQDTLRFDAAPTASGPMACAECAGPIHAYYYEAGGRVVCARCKQVLESVGGSFGRALLFGFGAALAGAAVYYAITKATGYELGLVAALLGVGVGYAVHIGGGKVGGRRYQWAAVLLTYFALGAAYMPFAMADAKEGRRQGREAKAVTDSLHAAVAAGDSAAIHTLAVRADSMGVDTIAELSAGATKKYAARADKLPKDGDRAAFGVVLGALLLALGAVALPVLVIVTGLPGSLFTGLILFIGMRRAWRMNAGAGSRGAITGPYKVGAR